MSAGPPNPLLPGCSWEWEASRLCATWSEEPIGHKPWSSLTAQAPARAVCPAAGLLSAIMQLTLHLLVFQCKWSRKGFIRTRWCLADWYVPICRQFPECSLTLLGPCHCSPRFSRKLNQSSQTHGKGFSCHATALAAVCDGPAGSGPPCCCRLELLPVQPVLALDKTPGS